MAHGRAEELTGNRRYRRQNWSINAGDCLILQVEVSVFGYPDGRNKCGAWRCEWRDATPADVAEGELCG
jgi:hypothetical protein